MKCFLTCSGDTQGKREINQDDWFLDSEKGVMAVFDGVGGSRDGHYASNLAKKAIENITMNLPAISQRDVHETGTLVCETLLKVNRELLQSGRNSMTTASVLVFCNTPDEGLIAIIVNIGDSRVYGWVNNGNQRLVLLTKDDSAYPEPRLDYVESESDITDSIIEVAFNARHIISKALGDRDVQKLEPAIFFAEDLDGFLLTTDGVHDNLSHNKLFEILLSGIRISGSSEISPASKIVGEAKSASNDLKNIRHKHDDITAIVVPLAN